MFKLNTYDINARPPRLFPIDSVPYRLFCTLGDKSYGHTNDTKQLIIVDTTTRQATNGLIFPAGKAISDIYSGYNCILILVADTSNFTYTLYRSSDGLSAREVHFLGKDPTIDGVHRPHVRLLQRGIEKGLIENKNALVLATYNVSTDNAVANPGEIGDAIYIAKSMDDGNTWQRVNTWNWDFSTGVGARNIKHFHAVRYDKWRNCWWFAAGDGNDESCIIRWDGISRGMGNIAPVNLGNYQGWDARTGSQRWRAVDILVTKLWIETFTDTIGDAVGGIWRIKPDFSQSHKVDHTNRGQQHDGWAALLTSNGTHLWCDDAREDTNSNSQRFIGIYGSANGDRYWEIGRISLTGTGVKLPRGFFEDSNGKIWFSCDGEAGKGTYNTTVYELTDRFREERSDNIGPCYYVDFQNGNDSNDGYSVATAWKTARNALANNKMTHGARLVLSYGVSTENGVSVIDYSANASPSTDTTRHIQISGQGRSNTTIILSGATEGWKDANTAKTWDIELCNLTIKQSDALKSIIWDNASATGGTPNWVFRDATIGDMVVGSSRAVYLRTSTAKSIRSRIENIENTGKYCQYIAGTALLTLHASIVDGGRSILLGGGKIIAYNCEFSRYANTGISIDSTATIAPLIVNSIFSGQTQTPITNASGTITLTSNDIYGCYYTRPQGVGVPDPIIPVAGALERDDYLIPYISSVIANTLDSVSIIDWGYNGQPYRKYPSIGSFEVYFDGVI